MRFCPQCGAPLMAGAKFCVDCGRALEGAAASVGEPGKASAGRGRGTAITTAFVSVFTTLAVVCLAVAALINQKMWPFNGATPPSASPATIAQDVAPAPNPAGAAPTAAAAPGQTVAANSPADQSQNGGLPPGHPAVELPTEARTFVDKIEKDARAKPHDVTAWNKFGAVSMRAAMFDPAYYGKAEEAYGHVLKLDADNLDALRGVGDIDYDKQHFDEAIAAYEHYLKKKPDDPEVRTDLATMYLYTGNADQAVVQYKKAIASKPGFFQAYYNMGIAYAQENKPDDAQATLKQAMALAPDDNAREQVKELIAKLNGEPAASASMQAAAASTPAASVAAKSTAAAASSAAASPAIMAKTASSPAAAPKSGEDDFHGDIEDMVRGLPIAGPKVASVEWPDKLKAKVLMNNFPMDQMPPFAKTKFESDMRAGIESAKQDNKISSPVEIDMVDGASGQVMESITQ